LKLQQALNHALNDSRYGFYLQKKALVNESFYDVFSFFKIALNEPDEEELYKNNVHFQMTEEMALFHLQTNSFYPKEFCISCKKSFENPKEIYKHIREETKQYFMPTQRIVIEVLLEAMHDD